MVTKVRCPNPECGLSADVPEDSLGRVGRCKHCGTRFTLSPSTDASPASPGTPEAVAPLEVIGRYQVREKLGSGAFGTVYRPTTRNWIARSPSKCCGPKRLHPDRRLSVSGARPGLRPKCTIRTSCLFTTPASTANTPSSPRP